MTGRTFRDVPTIVYSANGSIGDIHFFPRDAADVRNIDVAVMEAETPGITQPVRPNFRQAGFAVGKRIVSGNGIGVSVININSDNSSQFRVRVFAIFVGIAFSVAVSHRYVEKTIFPKLQLPRLMDIYSFSLFKCDNLTSSGGVGKIGISSGCLIFIYLAVPFRVSVENIKFTIVLVVRMKGQTQQAFFRLGANEVTYIQERF